jgi:BMFP domain-containing protein YqiC
MNRWKTVAGVVLIFMLGGLIGSLTTGWVLKRRHPMFRKDPETRVAYIMRRLADRLDLTEAQKPEVEAVVRQIDERMRDRFKRQRAEMRRLLEHETEALMPLLTPVQQEEFDRYRKELEAKHRERGGTPASARAVQPERASAPASRDP